VNEEPTPIDVLTENMNRSKKSFSQAIRVVLSHKTYQFNGFVYVFS
jgi:hypothetical protein